MITNFFTYMTIFWNAVISLFTGEETAVIGGLASVFDSEKNGGHDHHECQERNKGQVLP